VSWRGGERFARFNLELAEDKTRLLLFGRFAAAMRGRRGSRLALAWFGARPTGCRTRTSPKSVRARSTPARRMSSVRSFRGSKWTHAGRSRVLSKRSLPNVTR